MGVVDPFSVRRGCGRGVAANLNYDAGETVPNLVTVKLAADGTACLFTQYTKHLVADVAGYFTDEPDLVLEPVLNG